MKKIFTIMIAVLIMISLSAFVYADESAAIQCADTVADGTIDAKDALEVLKYAARLIDGFEVEEEFISYYWVGDVTGDYEITAADALEILKYAARLIDKFPISPIDAILSVEDMYDELLQNIENDVMLGQYKGLEIEIEETTITDEQVQEYIDSDLEIYGTIEEIREGVVNVGDTLSIDYVGTIDGKPFDGSSEEDALVTVGEGFYVEGFEESLIGKNIGDTYVTLITFPEDYYDDISGKTVEFTITINYKYGEVTPAELTDELVVLMGYGDDITTVDAYVNYVREMLKEDEEYMQIYEKSSEMISGIISSSTISNYSDPALNVDSLLEEEIAYFKEYAESLSMSYEEFIQVYAGMSTDEWEALLKEDCVAYVDSTMVFRAIAKAENITVSQEEYEEELTWYAMDYEIYGCESVEEFEELYGKEIYESLICTKVEEYLYDSIVVNYK